MANTQQRVVAPVPDPDLLAAVVLHTLVSDGREGMTATRVAVACERDHDDADDVREVEKALAILLEDGLATREEEHGIELYRPSRAAVRAAELSF